MAKSTVCGNGNNLCYVAITRAMKNLYVGDRVGKV